MGIDGPKETRIDFAGVNFNAKDAAAYGKSDGIYFINFKDGTTVRFTQQNRGASIYSDDFGSINRHNFNNFDNIFVHGSENQDYYSFRSCNGGSVSTYKDHNPDVISIDNDCSNIRVSKNECDELYNEGQGTSVND